MQREISRWISPGHRVVFTLRHLVFAQPKSLESVTFTGTRSRVAAVSPRFVPIMNSPPDTSESSCQRIDEPFSGLPTFAQGIRSRELKEFADPARRGAGRPAARCLGQGRGGFLY